MNGCIRFEERLVELALFDLLTGDVDVTVVLVAFLISFHTKIFIDILTVGVLRNKPDFEIMATDGKEVSRKIFGRVIIQSQTTPRYAQFR